MLRAMSPQAINVPDDAPATPIPGGVRLGLVVDRILGTWSLIKQVHQSDCLALRLPLAIDLCYSKDLGDHELFVAGLKYLYGLSRIESPRAPSRAEPASRDGWHPFRLKTFSLGKM
jgi:hypothetical protein